MRSRERGESGADEEKLADRRAVADPHQAEVPPPGAPERQDRLNDRQRERQRQRVVPSLDDHGLLLLG